MLLKNGKAGRLRPYVILIRGIAVKEYKVAGWRAAVARWLLAREADATAELARKGVAPITLCPHGLIRGVDRKLALGTAWIKGEHPSGEIAPHVAKAILATIEKVHKAGWTHNDLHRSNILVQEDPEGVRVWILDWASAVRPIWPLSSYLKARDRRHIEQMLGMRTGAKPLASRMWKSIKSKLRA